MSRHVNASSLRASIARTFDCGHSAVIVSANECTGAGKRVAIHDDEPRSTKGAVLSIVDRIISIAAIFYEAKVRSAFEFDG